MRGRERALDAARDNAGTAARVSNSQVQCRVLKYEVTSSNSLASSETVGISLPGLTVCVGATHRRKSSGVLLRTPAPMVFLSIRWVRSGANAPSAGAPANSMTTGALCAKTCRPSRRPMSVGAAPILCRETQSANCRGDSASTKSDVRVLRAAVLAALPSESAGPVGLQPGHVGLPRHCVHLADEAGHQNEWMTSPLES